MSRAKELFYSIASVVLVALVMGAFFYFFIYWGIEKANQDLPNCQEDEVLYPVEDYKGPGKNKTSDYGCVHIDTFRQGNGW